MKKQDIYVLLEEKMLGYADYIGVPLRARDEPMVAIPTTANLTARQIDTDMLAYTGKQVYVRQTVLERLQQAASLLAKADNSLQLEVIYGYRALEIQERLFETYKNKLQSAYSDEDLPAAVHRLVAIPEAAGHPAGGAVDIQILRNKRPLDFGTTVHEFVPDSYTFSPFISPAAWSNRQLLRRVMLGAGFAPFDGEWWHFSYGDKEWARYYNQSFGLYRQQHFTNK